MLLEAHEILRVYTWKNSCPFYFRCFSPCALVVSAGEFSKDWPNSFVSIKLYLFKHNFVWSIILDGAKLFANNTGPNITLYTARITVTFISPVARPGRFERTSCTLSRTWPFSYPASLCPPSFSAPSFRNLYTKQHCLYTIRNIARPFPSSSRLVIYYNTQG